MSVNYIKCKIKDDKIECNMNVIFENRKSNSKFTAIIDTGCTHSHISMSVIYPFLSEKDIKKLELRYIGMGRQTATYRGVESYNKNIKTNQNICVKNKFSNIMVEGIELKEKELYVSYDMSGIALLGMKILENWDFHIGKNKENNTILLGCPKDKLNVEYYRALQEEFELGKNILYSVTTK